MFYLTQHLLDIIKSIQSPFVIFDASHLADLFWSFDIINKGFLLFYLILF